MWKSQVGHDVKIEATANDDDDWETDPDFVVRPTPVACSRAE